MSYSSAMNTLVMTAILIFIAFIAAVVVTVILYKKYIATDNIYKNPHIKNDWGPFFRFEHLVIENTLKVLYIFTTSLIAFISAAFIITAFTTIGYDAGGAFGSILFIVIVCFVLEILNRLGFEFSLLTVLIWKNTSAIRKTLTNGSDVPSGMPQQAASYKPAPGAAVPFPQQTYVAPQASASAAAQSPYTAAAPQHPSNGAQQASSSAASATTQATPSSAASAPAASAPSAAAPVTQQTQSGAWSCPACGAFNKVGTFCAQCGNKKN